MPHPAHFIGGFYCKFRLATYVGKYIVSTVGEMVSDVDSLDFKEIGLDRLYETMVFKARKSKHKCCPYEIIVSDEMDSMGYNNVDSATKGHLKMCLKWSRK